MNVDIVLRLLPSWGERGCLIISQLLMLFCSGLLLWGCWQQMQINWNIPSPVSGWSMGLFYASGALFGVSACVIHIYEAARLASGGEIFIPKNRSNSISNTQLHVAKVLPLHSLKIKIGVV